MGQKAFKLEEWLKRSTRASGVPLKVKDAASISALQVLVSGARRTAAVVGRLANRGTKQS